MSITLTLSDKLEAALAECAKVAGEDVATYATKVLETVAAPRTLEELSGPIFERFKASGTTDDELGEELEQAKHEMRAERRARLST